MICSLIITTYNWPEALERSLYSVFEQSVLPTEIIVADDGSDMKTANLIKQIQKLSPVPIIHSWQEDKGFRAAASRNKAIAKSHNDYIIMIDGDMVLHKHFVKDHLRCAKKGYFLQGSRAIMSSKLSKSVIQSPAMKLNPFLPQLRNRLNALYIPVLSRLICNRSYRAHKGIRSCNISVFYEDIIQANGFNEDFITWGREDSEFVERLYNNGLRRKNLKFSGIQFHIYHNEGSSNAENDAVMQKAIDEQLSWCENGIDKYL